MQLLRFAALVLVLMLQSGLHAENIETQTFDDLASATTAGWVGVNNATANNSYGFSDTNFTGGSSPEGEAGGALSRAGVTGYYADLSIGGFLTRADSFRASGEFDVTSVGTSPPYNGGFYASHFSSLDVATVGANIGEDTDTSLRFRSIIIFPDGTIALGNDLLISGQPNSDRLWSYVWDPSGGAFGRGRLALTIDGPGGGDSILDLTPAHDGKTFALNGFGLLNRAFTVPDTSLLITAYIDDVTYTVAAVPEPSSAAIAAWGLIGLVGVVVSRYRRVMATLPRHCREPVPQANEEN